MPLNALKKSLDKLQEAINHIDATDATSKEKLNVLIKDVYSKLEGPDNTEERKKLLGHLKESSIHFETAHPVIAKTLEEMVAILVKLGL